MSSTDPMRDDSWILSETMRKTSLRPSRFRQLQNTKSSSLMRQITQPMMYNSSYGRLLRSLVGTADSSSLATLKTKLSNHFIPVAQWLNSELGESKDQQLQQIAFANESKKFSMQKESSTTTRSLVELINKHFPDWRRVLNECQRYSWVVVRLTRGILASFSDVKVNELIKNLKEKDFPEVRKWIVSNLDNDTAILLRRIYDVLYDSLVPNSIPAAVLVLAKYQYQAAFVADQEINMLACLTEIMVECEFK